LSKKQQYPSINNCDFIKGIPLFTLQNMDWPPVPLKEVSLVVYLSGKNSRLSGRAYIINARKLSVVDAFSFLVLFILIQFMSLHDIIN